MRLLLLAVVGLLLLSACGGGGKEEELGVQEIVAQTTQKTAAVKSFHFVFTVENAPTRVGRLSLTSAEGDLAVPDKIQAKVTGSLSGVPLESELIVVGERRFLRDPLTHEWRDLGTGGSPVSFFDPAKGVLAIIKGVRALEKTGSEKVGGADSYRLKGKVRARDLTAILGNPPTDRLVDAELWVGKEDLVLRRIRLEGPISEEEPANVVRTVEISDFDKAVTIKAPEVSG